MADIVNVPKPFLEADEFDYCGKVITPVIKNRNNSAMTVSGDMNSTSAGEKTITVKLKSGYQWEDEGTEDITLAWFIRKSVFEIPALSFESTVYSGKSQTNTVIGYDSYVMTRSGTSAATNAGNYSVTFSLKDTNSASWSDGSVEPKVLNWEIEKAVKQYEKPYCNAEYTYNGTTITAAFTNFVVSVMDSTGRAAVKAGNYTAVFSLKTSANYIYQWTDGTASDVEVDWVIKKLTGVAIPTISQNLYYYGGYRMNTAGTAVSYAAYRYPSITGFNSNIMEQSGASQGYRNTTGNFVETVGKWYCTSSVFVGKRYVSFWLKDPDSCEWENGTSGQITYEWSIVREIKLLPKPYLETLWYEYDGTQKTPVIANHATSINLSGNLSETAEGNYFITAALYRQFGDMDLYDYRWEDNTIDNIYLDWQISNGSIIIPSIASTNFVYDGLPHFPVVGGYDKNTMTMSGGNETAAGEYEVVFSLKDPDSGTWNDGSVEDKVFKWSISKAVIEKPSISPDFMEYDGEFHTIEFVENDNDHSFIVDGFNSNMMTYSGDTRKTNVGNYCVVIALKDPDSCTWADGSVDPVELPWEIRKKTVLLDKPYLSPEKFLYDGMAYSPEIVGFKVLGMVVKSESVTSAVAAGKYKIVLALRKDPNIIYLWGDAEQNSVDEDLELFWEIEKAVGENAVKIPSVESLEFIYDGGLKAPVISDCDNTVISVDGVVSAKNVGEYEIIFALKDKNSCEWDNGSSDDIIVKWIIKHQKIEEKPCLLDSSFVFSGKSFTPEIVNFDASKMTVSGKVSASAAGEYTIIVALKEGFQWSDDSADEVELSWAITKLSVEIPHILFSEFVYNGLFQTPDVEYDRDFITYGSDIGAVAAGNYSIVFSLIDKNSCYWSDGSVGDVAFEWKIKKGIFKKPVVLDDKFNFDYDGSEHSLEISEYNTDVITKSGVLSAVNAGEYSVVYSLKDKNSASWEDGSVDDVVFEWKVNKAKVEKPYIQSSKFLYDGEIYAPNIIGFDPSSMVMNGDSEKKNPGNYTLVIKLLKNYEWNDGTVDNLIFPWVIINANEVVSVAVPSVREILFQYNGEVHSPKIGEFNGEIISVSGVTSAVNSGAYAIIFALSDKVGYKWETGSSDDISIEWKIEKIRLEKPYAVKLNYVYNGGYHLPVIHGVNEKLMIASGNTKQVNAGKYRCVIAITDKVNYIWEDSSAADIVFNWEIEKKVVSAPYLDRDSFEYDGKNKTPVIKNFNSGIMEIIYVSNGERISNTSAANVGKYKIVILLGEKKIDGGAEYYLRNYQWADGTVNNLVLNWEIVPGYLDYPTLIENSLVYNWQIQTPKISGFLSGQMVCVGTWRAIDVGVYQIGFKLKEESNFKWRNPEDEGKLFTWEISRKVIKKIPFKKNDLVYNGQKQSPVWVDYDIRQLDIGGVNEAVNAGGYIAEFTPTKNFMWADGSIGVLRLSWVIAKLVIGIPTQANILYYNGKEQKPAWRDFDAAQITYSGETSGKNAGEHNVSCECNENCFFGATGTRYCDTVWEIRKKKLQAPEVERNYPYTGEEIFAVFKNYYPDLMTANGDLSGVNVGDYAAYFDIKDKDNYTWADNVYADKNGYAGGSWKIVSSQKVVKVPYQNNTLIYNGEKQSPSFASFDSSVMMIVGGSPSETYAGIYYATFRLIGNAVWEDGTTEDKVVTWEIDKKVLPCPFIFVSVAEGGMYYYEIAGKRYPVWRNYSPDYMTMSGDTYDTDGEWHITVFELKDPNNFAWGCVEGGIFTINWKLSTAYLPKVEPGSGAVRVHIPRQIKPPFEDGSTKYPEWDSFNNTAIVKLGGVWEGISADTYYVILELREGYIWEDGTAEIKAVPWKILEIGENGIDEIKPLIVHIPEQINIPSYDGYVKEPEWNIWDKFGFDIVKGELYGVLAGVYLLVLRLQTGYIWEDGTLEDKVVTWVINPGGTDDPSDDESGGNVPDEEVSKTPPPEKDGTENIDNNGGGKCGCCCCNTGLFEVLKNSCNEETE